MGALESEHSLFFAVLQFLELFCLCAFLVPIVCVDVFCFFVAVTYLTVCWMIGWRCDLFPLMNVWSAYLKNPYCYCRCFESDWAVYPKNPNCCCCFECSYCCTMCRLQHFYFLFSRLASSAFLIVLSIFAVYTMFNSAHNNSVTIANRLFIVIFSFN